MALAHLPPELLAEILGHLNCTDVLRVRQTCRKLCEVSKHRSVWHKIYHDVATTDITRQLWLEKPLDLYDSSELEDAVLRLKATELGWPKKDAELVVERSIKPSGYVARLLLVPGGRWIIAARDEWVDYCDLDEECLIWRPLIPKGSMFLGGSQSRPCEIVDMELDCGIRTLQHPLLSQFNIAIACQERLGFRSSIQIWGLSTVIDGRKVKGLTARLLKYIPDLGEPFASEEVEHLCLCGQQVLYSVWSHFGARRMFVAVRWTEVNTGKDYRRRSFQMPDLGIRYAYLLPNNILILLRSTSCDVYDFNSVPEERKTSCQGSLPCTRSVSLGQKCSSYDVDPLMVFGDGQIRLIVPTGKMVFAVILKDDLATYVETTEILGHGNRVDTPRYGCYRGVEMASDKVLLLSYRQADATRGLESNRTVFRHAPTLIAHVAFDEGSGRVVGMTYDKFHVLDLALQYKRNCI